MFKWGTNLILFFLSSNLLAINFIFKIDKWMIKVWISDPCIYNAMSLPTELCLRHNIIFFLYYKNKTKEFFLGLNSKFIWTKNKKFAGLNLFLTKWRNLINKLVVHVGSCIRKVKAWVCVCVQLTNSWTKQNLILRSIYLSFTNHNSHYDSIHIHT
jgi:hypothetical protein